MPSATRRSQSQPLGGVELEHEIHGETRPIALHRLDQCPGLDSVEGGEFGIEQHALAAQDQDRAGDFSWTLRRGELCRGHPHAGLR